MTAWNRDPATRLCAVVADVDGTLVTKDKKLTSEVRDALARLHENGIAFSIISSRPPRGLRAIIETLGVSAPIAGFNGGALTRPDLTPIAEHVLAPETVARALDLLDARQSEVWIFSGRDWLVRDLNGPYIGVEHRTVEFPPTRVETFEPAFETAAKIVAVSPDFAFLDRCEDELGVALGTQANVARSQPYYLDITHPLANKGDGLSEFARLLGVPLGEIAVIGDGANDVPMFERSGLAIAMGNSAPEVRGRADFVTAGNDENGFARAVEQFVFPRAKVNAVPAGDRR
jgi:Cof subfamily protein (haloacid dehalogenase superfamily)